MWIWEFDQLKQYFLLLMTMFTDTKNFFLKTKLNRSQAQNLVCVVMYVSMIPLLFTIILAPFILLVPLFAWLSLIIFELLFGIMAALVNLKVKDKPALWALSYAPYIFAVLAITQPLASLASLVAFIYMLVERYKATNAQVGIMLLLTLVMMGLLFTILWIPIALVFGLSLFF